MTTFIWNTKYETGHKFIDNEHQILFAIGNELVETPFTSMSDFKRKYLELIEYANLHFANEEYIMKTIGYVNLDVHRSIHASILKEMKLVVSQRDSLKLIQRNLVSLITKWILKHIEQEDMLYRTAYIEWKKRVLSE